jgi:hypothetical protein
MFLKGKEETTYFDYTGRETLLIMIHRREKLCLYTANEGPVRFQYKCLVPIFVFPEIKL